MIWIAYAAGIVSGLALAAVGIWAIGKFEDRNWDPYDEMHKPKS